MSHGADYCFMCGGDRFMSQEVYGCSCESIPVKISSALDLAKPPIEPKVQELIDALTTIRDTVKMHRRDPLDYKLIQIAGDAIDSFNKEE